MFYLIFKDYHDYPVQEFFIAGILHLAYRK